MATQAEPAPRPKGLKLLSAALASRKTACMLALGFSSGLPFALLVGTLTAWLGEVGVKLATIGVFSWIGLAYSFKFLWSPLVDRVPLPLLEKLGRRRGWILLCQVMILLAFAGLALTDPKAAIGNFVLLAFLGAVASATQDIAIDGWRIDNAGPDAPIELLSALFQFGYRTASIVGGAIALMLAARLSWAGVYFAMAGVVVLLIGATLAAPDTPRPPQALLHGALAEPGALKPRMRAACLFAVGASWLWAIWRILTFAVSALAPVAPGGKAPSAADFTKAWGPLILVSTVFIPLLVAALANWMKQQPERVLSAPDPTQSTVRTIANHLYSALVEPLAELSGRLRWGVLTIIGFILTYAICYNIWASFANPFYLVKMQYTKDEVALASKIFGIIMTMLGISLGGYLYSKIGRFPTLVIGAVLPPLGNFLYADLADGAPLINGFATFIHLPGLVNGVCGLIASMGLGAYAYYPKLMWLLLAICYENVVTGLALTAFVAYVSSVVSKNYAAIQYALLSSLLSLVGTLSRGAVGEAFDTYGYAPVFRWTAATAVVSTLFVLLEWWRVRRMVSRESQG